jgi:hypothetical protein
MLKMKNLIWMIGSQTSKKVKASVLLIALLICMVGCKTTRVHDYYPVIPVPNRPSISSNLDKDDFKEMAKYAQKLEVSIKKYNEYAAEKNAITDEFLENN